jgi:hypothetical protein
MIIVTAATTRIAIFRDYFRTKKGLEYVTAITGITGAYP